MPPYTGNPNDVDPATLGDTLKGSCLCGSIKVTITDSELWTKRRGHLCHCANCRKVAGSYVASNFNIEEEKVQIVDDNQVLKKFIDKNTGSGKPVDRYFCSTCGCPVKSITPLLPGRVIVKMGMFPRIPAPEWETFALHRHDWQGKHEGVVQWRIKVGEEQL
ncbi:glutathione-dependent formaldehyde-activating [Fusarium albosuccineum]|uniref:Glutathione-dependent formaldehyde-activating n=1 Tax=Fusarium albosuccineum TaxID=1237068 RepID=A0A8H4PCN7_9HYPO|nr:glutathione-dependent formaldehyde-activating [Fusarium albosuccineum]